MFTDPLLQNTFQKLPKPFTLTSSQIRSYYQSLYSQIHESYISEDFPRINNLLNINAIKNVVPDLKYPEDNPPGDTLLKDLIRLLYDIITTFPIKYYNTQQMAVIFLREILSRNKEIEGLTLEWKRFYKYFQKITKITDFLPTMQIQAVIKNLFLLSMELKIYFHNENEDDINKFLIRNEFDLFDIFLSNRKGIYKPYFHYLISSLKENNNELPILFKLKQIFLYNIEDDFSIFLPKLKELIVLKILMNRFNDQEIFVFNISELTSLLFISPPTRKGILDLFENLFQSLKSLCHPSISGSEMIISFIDNFVIFSKKFLNILADDNLNKKYFNMKVELGPSQEEIHKILIITSAININNINRIGLNISNALIETKLDPSLIDYYFDVSFQCVNLVDAINVSKGAWNILGSLIMSIEKSEILINNFESLFLLSTKNLLNLENQFFAAQFISISLLKIPFNKENTIKGLEHINFAALANSYYTNLFSRLQLAQEIDQDFFSNIKFSTIALFGHCDNSIFDELLPIFTLLASDKSLVYYVNVITIIISNYCIYSNQEQALKIVKSFKRQIELKNHNLKYLTYLLSNFISASMVLLNTENEISQLVKYLTEFTQNDNKLISGSIWNIIPLVFNSYNQRLDLKINLKKELVNGNILEFGDLDDFDIIDANKNIDLSQIAFDLLNPFYDILLTSNDVVKIIELINGVGPLIYYILSNFHINSEGFTDKNNINELYNGPIHLVPDLIKPTFPLKDKFIKCVLRILKDFPENERLISMIINITYTAKHNHNTSLDVIKKYVDSFYNLKKKYNSATLLYLLTSSIQRRENFLIFPLNDSYKQLIENVVELSVSNYNSVRKESIEFISRNIQSYFPFIKSVIFEKIFNKMESIPYDIFVLFLYNIPNANLFLDNDKLTVKILIYLLKNFDSHLNMSHLIHDFVCQLFPFRLPNKIYTFENNKSEYIDLLNEIEKNYLSKNTGNRTYNTILLLIIFMCLKEVKDASTKILEYIMYNITHYNEKFSGVAFNCLSSILRRRIKLIKEKILVKEIPTIDAFPSIFDQVLVNFPENGVYFTTNRIEKEKESSSSYEYNDNLGTSSSIDANIEVLEVNQEIKRIFKSFKNIKIEWVNDELFESRYFEKYSIESCPFKRESYNRKKCKFVNDEFLLKNIKNIFSSAMNSLNEKNTTNKIVYDAIWEKYASTVGPYCTNILHRLCKKYLTEYYQYRPNITAVLMSDMIVGFFKSIIYWKIEDRIQFFKLVALPVICVISSNSNSSGLFISIFGYISKLKTPYYYAPILKVFYEIIPNGPNIPFYARTITSIIAITVSNKPFFFFNSIEKLKLKFIDPFIADFDKYNTNEISDIILLLFSLLKSCSLKKSESLFYSEKIVEKKNMILQTFDDLFEISIENKDSERNMISSLSNSFILFENSSIDVQLMLMPLFLKYLHKIFNFLNSFHSIDEDIFINNFCLFIQNDFFFIHHEFEYDFVSSLINEMMKSSLLMQLTLSVSLNKNIEKNIFNISVDDYDKYENLLLKYNRHVIENNLGNEMRLNIAKILGIFEVRKCTFVYDNRDNFNDNLIKAGSIILNSYLFNHSDEKVAKAFDFIEKYATTKDTKSRDFFESCSKIFINRHSNHVMDEAEELVSLYRNVSMPSYIA